MWIKVNIMECLVNAKQAAPIKYYLLLSPSNTTIFFFDEQVNNHFPLQEEWEASPRPSSYWAVEIFTTCACTMNVLMYVLLQTSS